MPGGNPGNLGQAMGPGGMLGMPGTGKKQKPPANPWDNKLILIGGGSLLLLVLIGVALAFSLNRRTGDEAFQAAEEAYSNGQYGEAIANYEVFLQKSPKHPKASQGRVHRAVCLMRRLMEGSKGEAWVRAFRTVSDMLN